MAFVVRPERCPPAQFHPRPLRSPPRQRQGLRALMWVPQQQQQPGKMSPLVVRCHWQRQRWCPCSAVAMTSQCHGCRCCSGGRSPPQHRTPLLLLAAQMPPWRALLLHRPALHAPPAGRRPAATAPEGLSWALVRLLAAVLQQPLPHPHSLPQHWAHHACAPARLRRMVVWSVSCGQPALWYPAARWPV